MTHPMMEDHGPGLTVASSEIGAVTMCPCGVITVTLHSLSLRFEPEAFKALALMLQRSQQRISRSQPVAPGVDDVDAVTPPPTGVHSMNTGAPMCEHDKQPFVPPADATAPASAKGSRRKRLWELPHSAHCPIVGVCVPLAPLRKMMDKTFGGPSEFDDYHLHVGVVAQCTTRTSSPKPCSVISTAASRARCGLSARPRRRKQWASCGAFRSRVASSRRAHGPRSRTRAASPSCASRSAATST